MVSRVTSDVDTISQFMQFGGIILVLSLGQIAVATGLMFYYSPLLTGVVWLCFVPLLFVIRRFQAIVGRAYTIVRERVGDLLARGVGVRRGCRHDPGLRRRGAHRRTASTRAIEAHRSAVDPGAGALGVALLVRGQLVAGLAAGRGAGRRHLAGRRRRPHAWASCSPSCSWSTCSPSRCSRPPRSSTSCRTPWPGGAG